MGYTPVEYFPPYPMKKLPQTLREKRLETLKSLPDIFHVEDFRRKTKMIKPCSHETAKRVLNIFSKQNAVKPLGPRWEWFYNYHKTNGLTNKMLFKALRKVSSKSVLSGAYSFERADFISSFASNQKSGCPYELVVPDKHKYLKMNEVEYFPRCQTWFKKYKSHIVLLDGFPTLLPEYALVDLCEANLRIPDPTDWSLSDSECERIEIAFKEMGVVMPDKVKWAFDGGRYLR